MPKVVWMTVFAKCSYLCNVLIAPAWQILAHYSIELNFSSSMYKKNMEASLIFISLVSFRNQLPLFWIIWDM